MGRVAQLMLFSADANFEASVAPELLNFGKLGAERGLYSPPDIQEAYERFGANCGPASFAAVRRSPVSEVMPFFPGFPEKDWTTVGAMRRALAAANLPFKDIKNELPLLGLALLQLEINEKPLHPLFSLSHTHWVGVAGGCFFDVNWGGWLPIPVWEQVVFPKFRFGAKPATGWHLRNAITVWADHLVRSAFCFAETKEDRIPANRTSDSPS